MAKLSNTKDPKAFFLLSQIFNDKTKGDYNAGDTPLTIPNREVKSVSADGTTIVEE